MYRQAANRLLDLHSRLTALLLLLVQGNSPKQQPETLSVLRQTVKQMFAQQVKTPCLLVQYCLFKHTRPALWADCYQGDIHCVVTWAIG